mmetsp:Transcript_24524/g.41692  ORF Transcript_24524/g.41692 Transcript_24524/m.41692 type:complete len:89 (-) Transcript_24524:7-273(-)
MIRRTKHNPIVYFGYLSKFDLITATAALTAQSKFYTAQSKTELMRGESARVESLMRRLIFSQRSLIDLVLERKGRRRHYASFPSKILL